MAQNASLYDMFVDDMLLIIDKSIGEKCIFGD